MRIAAAPVSWGVFEVTLTSEVPGPIEFLDDVVELGYAGTESGSPGYLGRPSEARRLLADRGLDLAGTFLPFDFVRQEVQERNVEAVESALDFVEALAPDGSEPVIVLSDDYQREERMAVAGNVAQHPEVALPTDDWPAFTTNVNRVAAVCADRGFTVSFHPHVGSLVETPDEIERLMGGLQPSLIGLCMDIGHVTFGGGDAVQLTAAYSGAISHVHAKDVDRGILGRIIHRGGGLGDAWEQGVFCDLGAGGADVAGCLRILEEDGYTGWVVVEQDRLPSGGGFLDAVRRSQRSNREFLKNLGW